MSPLVDYARRGLKNCYMEDRKCWSYIYHLDGRPDPNESFPAGDVFYSLNVILGLAAANGNDRDHEYDLPALLQENARRLFEIRVPTYALGMALWASARLGVPLDPAVGEKIESFIKDRSNWRKFRAQDIGMILTGIAEQKACGNESLDAEAHALIRFILDRFLSGSGLFYDAPHGLRRNFGSFATQTYLTTACYHYGLRYGDDVVLAIADAAAKKLISLQGENGEWPWFYFVPRGLVVDTYEVYSVHQHGMAPLFLTFAEQRGVPGATEAIAKGFRWIFGNNRLKRNMLIPETGMFYRSIIRQEELHGKKRRVARAVVNGITGRPDRDAPPKNLTLRQECRSYELGWIIYSFGNRADMPDITHNEQFTKALESRAAA